MPNLPTELAFVILAFRPLFSHRIWESARVLLLGAILAPGKRTVTSALRVMGLTDEHHFQNYHRTLNRAVWSCRHAGLILLRMLLATFVPRGPLVLGLDDTIERRWGASIRARGIYRDPVRSSDSHFVKTSGLRWLSLMLFAEIPWAGHVWALPFLTALAPSERYWQKQGRKPKLLTDWARQLVLQVQHWLPSRTIVVVADGAFASLQLLSDWASRRRPITCVTRLRLDARLFRPAPPRKTGAMGRPRLVGTRLPSLQQVLADRHTIWQRLSINNWYGRGQRMVELTSATAVWYHTGLPPVPIRWVLVRDPLGKFETRALLCTQLDQEPRDILQWFLWRWQVEVTFQQVRTHLGVETQRQWSDLAIARTTPVLLGLFSIVTLLAHRLAHNGQLPIRQAAWYSKTHATFSDAIAAVRQQLWHPANFFTSHSAHNMVKIPHALLSGLCHAVCYAA
jgi:DDE superfamily endonuclease